MRARACARAVRAVRACVRACVCVCVRVRHLRKGTLLESSKLLRGPVHALAPLSLCLAVSRVRTPPISSDSTEVAARGVGDSLPDIVVGDAGVKVVLRCVDASGKHARTHARAHDACMRAFV